MNMFLATPEATNYQVLHMGCLGSMIFDFGMRSEYLGTGRVMADGYWVRTGS